MWCKIGKDVAVSLAESLADNKSLKVFRIQHPSIGIYSEGVSALIKLIENNHHLQEVVLIDDSVDEVALNHLRGCGHSLKVLKLES